MKVRNQAKLARLAEHRRFYIAARRKLEAGRSRAALARRPGGLHALQRLPAFIDLDGDSA